MKRVFAKTSRELNKVSLPRAISKLGYASRSQAMALIQAGSVKVNGKEEKNPHRWVNLRTDTIQIEQEVLQKKNFRYLIVHKPSDVVTTHSDEKDRETVFDIIGDAAKGLSPVGRLDKDTTGLLLLTNNHEVGDVLTSPDSGVEKTYIVTLDKSIETKDLARVQKGIEIKLAGDTYRTKPADAKLQDHSTVEITIQEGKNRQLHRMFEVLGYAIVRLHRVSVGPLGLGELQDGQFRPLTSEEIKALKLLVQSRKKKSESSAIRYQSSKHSPNAKHRMRHR
ncbi:MAG: rRNA pseudouridine synthase [Ignavibacteriales bacterium]|nr:rRNA pseudouridine synthase [Ignavibacteriales bacterium]